MKTRRTEIIVETYEFLAIKPGISSNQIWCDDCDATVPALAPEQAAAAVADHPRTIYRWVESGRVHFTEDSEGRLFICLNSLLQRRKETLP